MHLRDHEQLGEEPLYCEADHGSVYHSGSDDDYYEAPEHRRLRIEAKAVQFLHGQVPYLLSARLEGPFDKESWTNPWRSKRAERQLNSSRSAAKQSAKSVQGPRADAADKATDDLPDTQRTTLYPLPSPETTNPPSDRKNPYLDDREYNRIKEWRDVVQVEDISTPADPFPASQHNEGSNTSSSSKKRPAHHDWLRKDEGKKHKSTQFATSLLVESPSRAAAQARSQRISRQSSVLSQSRPRPTARSEDAVAPRDATICNFAASGPVAKGFETTPGLPSFFGKSLSRDHMFIRLNSDFSEDELSIPSATPSGRAARSSAGKLSGLDRSPDRRSRRPRRSEKSASQDGGQANNSGLLLAETEGDIAQSAPRPAATTNMRSGPLVHSQQDSSFCFHQLRAKSPAKEASQFSAGFSSPQPVDADAVTTARAGHQCHQDQSAHEQDDNDEPDPDRMDVDTHDRIPHLHESCSDPSPLAKGSNDEQRAEPGIGADQVRPPENTLSIQIHGPTTSPEVSPERAEDPRPSPTQNDMDTSGADWTTYINTQDLSVVSNRPLQANQGHDESDSDWATVVSNEEVVMSDVDSIETAKVEQHLPVVEQGPGDTSESEWSTFLHTPDRSTTTPKQSGSSALRRDTEDMLEEDSDSDWSTCRSVSSPLEADQTGNTSHEPLPVDLVDSEGKSPQGSPGPIAVPPAQDTEASSSPQEDLSTRASQDTVVRILNTAENTGPEDPGASESSEHAASPLAERPSSELEQESVGCLGADQDEDMAKSDTGPVLGAEMTPAENPTEHRDLTQGEVVMDSKATETTNDGAADSIAVNAGLHVDAKTLADERPAESRDPPDVDIVIDLKTPERARNTQHTADSRAVSTAMSSTKRQQCQSPWDKSNVSDAQPAQAPVHISYIASERGTEPEAPQEQSPWFKEHAEVPIKKNGQSTHCDGKAGNDGSPSDLSFLAGRALTFVPTPQTPWMGDKLPSPDFSLSVKRFSDFMKPSPTKKRSSPKDQSILRSPSFGSNILFPSSAPSRPPRRVTFAPLPEEEAIDSVDPATQGGSMYVEEDVSYFGPAGKKTTTVRVTRPTMRAASPPPRDVNSAEAGKIPDHDDKFAKHFEAMSKRKKKPVQRPPRLLPSDSPQTNSSQDLGAMAEAFIQASQTRRKGLELDAPCIDSPARRLSQSHTPAEQATPLRRAGFVDQENAAPVDDVNAVLDNLDDFLDNTWGMNLSMDEGQDAEAGFQQTVSTPPTQSVKSPAKQDGDATWGLHFNVWAD